MASDWGLVSPAPVSTLVPPAEADYPNAVLFISAMLWGPYHYPGDQGEKRMRDIDDAFRLVAAGRVDEALTYPWVQRVHLRSDVRYIPPSVRADVLASGECRACGSTEELEVDHVFPVARGGDSRRSNLQPLCKPCNRDKRDQTMEEWGGVDG